MDGFVTLLSPTSGEPWACPEVSVEHFVEKGWTKADPDAADPDSSVLRGAALEAALKDAGLPSTGTADEKRAALAAHHSQEG